MSEKLTVRQFFESFPDDAACLDHVIDVRYGLDVVHALRRLQDGVDHNRPGDAVARLKLGEQLVEIVDVPRPLDLGQHDHVELVPAAATIRVTSSSVHGCSGS